MTEPLQLHKREPNPRIVENLERMLADAKSGKITALVGFAHHGNEMAPFLIGDPDCRDLVFGLERLKFEVIQKLEGAGK